MTDLRHVAQLLHEAAVPRASGRRRWPPGWVGGSARPTATPTTRSARAASSPTPRPCRSSPSTAARVSSSRSSLPLLVGRLDVRDRRARLPRSRQRQQRTIDVGRTTGRASATHRSSRLEEGQGEDLRLLYVALTRARHQAVLWWAGAADTRALPSVPAPLRPRPDGVVAPNGAKARSGRRRRGGVRRRSAPSVSVERVGPARCTGMPTPSAPPDARGSRVRPDARHELAPDVLLEHHPRPCTSSRPSAASPRRR